MKYILKRKHVHTFKEQVNFGWMPTSFSPYIYSKTKGRKVERLSCMCGGDMEKKEGDQREKRAPQVRVFDNEEELSTALADYVAQLSEKAVRERGSFSIVLSGGNLIYLLRSLSCFYLNSFFPFEIENGVFFSFLFSIQTITNWSVCVCVCVFLWVGLSLDRKLTRAPYVKTLDWSKWHVFWAEENVVGRSHPDSNYKQAKDGFLSKVCIFFRLFSLHITEALF